ncbi:hypothetical protein D3C75_1153800 [compost metagenome]
MLGTAFTVDCRTANRRFVLTEVHGTQERNIARRLLMGRLLNLPPGSIAASLARHSTARSK